MSIFIDMTMLKVFNVELNPYAKANLIKCCKYNQFLEFLWILYVDANNVYGWAMMLHLPTGGFEWVDVTER